MSRGGTLILLGVLTALMPFSGLPSTWRTICAVVLGAAVLWIGVTLRTRETRSAHVAPQEPEALS